MPGESPISKEALERFSVLWTEAEPVVRMYLKGAIFHREDAQDLLQKTALCAFRKFAEYREELPFRSWVLGIAHFETLAFFRDRGRRPEYVDTDTAEQVANRIEDSAGEISDCQARQAEAVQKAVAALPQKHRQMLMMRYNQGLSFEEIAAQLEMLPGAVRTALSRIRQNLKDAVARLENDDES